MARAKTTRQINATCPPVLFAAAQRAAKSREIPWAEWVRQAIREKLEREAHAQN